MSQPRSRGWGGAASPRGAGPRPGRRRRTADRRWPAAAAPAAPALDPDEPGQRHVHEAPAGRRTGQGQLAQLQRLPRQHRPAHRQRRPRSTAPRPAAPSTWPTGSRSCGPRRGAGRTRRSPSPPVTTSAPRPLVSAAFHDEPTIEMMNSLGLDVSSVGNHEFDEGVDRAASGSDRRLPPGRRLPGRRRLRRRRSSPTWPPTSSTRRPSCRSCCRSRSQGRRGVPVGFVGMTLEGTPEHRQPGRHHHGRLPRRGRDRQQVRASCSGLSASRRWCCSSTRAAARTPAAGARPVRLRQLHRRRSRRSWPACDRSTAWSSPATPTGATPARCRTRPARTTRGHQRRHRRPAGHRHRLHAGPAHRPVHRIIGPATWSSRTASATPTAAGSSTARGSFVRDPALVDPDAKAHRRQVPHRGGPDRQPGGRRDHGRHRPRTSAPTGESPLGDVIADAQLAYTDQRRRADRPDEPGRHPGLADLRRLRRRRGAGPGDLRRVLHGAAVQQPGRDPDLHRGAAQGHPGAAVPGLDGQTRPADPAGLGRLHATRYDSTAPAGAGSAQ